MKKNIKPTMDTVKIVRGLRNRFSELETTTDREDEINEVLSEISDYMDNYAWADVEFEESGKTGLKDCFEEIIAPAVYDEIRGRNNYFFDQGLFACMDGKWALLPPHANPDNYRETFIYDGINCFHGGLWGTDLYIVIQNNQVGLIDKNAKQIIPCEFDKIYSFENDMALVVKGDKMGFLTFDLDFIEPIYDEIAFPELDDYYRVRLGDQWGYVDENKQFTLGKDDGGTPPYYGCFI